MSYGLQKAYCSAALLLWFRHISVWGPAVSTLTSKCAGWENNYLKTVYLEGTLEDTDAVETSFYKNKGKARKRPKDLSQTPKTMVAELRQGPSFSHAFQQF